MHKMKKAQKMKEKKRNSSEIPFAGVVTALATPFLKGRVDYRSLKKLVRFQIDHGVEGFVVNGTTGESPTLDWSEVEMIFKTVKAECDHSVPLILGTGSNSTTEAIQKTKLAQRLGADAVLVVVPYYNKPPQRGLIAHYRAIAQSTSKPVILYNVPGRTVTSMSTETIIKLSKVKNIAGIKEASGREDVILELSAKLKNQFLLSSGDDMTCLNFILSGGHGVVSVLSHVIPQTLRTYCDRARQGDFDVLTDYRRYETLNKLMGVESNPIPVKMALHLMGIFESPELRLPLVELNSIETKKLKHEMIELGILS
jgi:4-hydroxy-tetrahydrodipicolinate synthase